MRDHIVIKGARENNLKNIDVEIPRDALVDTMHEALARPELDDFEYGCFMSGPSKTADIEQALVFGAHGPMSITVVLR